MDSQHEHKHDFKKYKSNFNLVQPLLLTILTYQVK